MHDRTLFDRLMALSVTDGNGCRIWQRSKDTRGYGHLRVAGRLMRAHRAMWVAVHGTLGDGLCILHRCDVRACIEPEHLFAGSQLENIADRHTKGRSRGPSAERSATAKITREQAEEIASLRGCELQKTTAARFGLTQAHVSAIQRGACWR